MRVIGASALLGTILGLSSCSGPERDRAPAEPVEAGGEQASAGTADERRSEGQQRSEVQRESAAQGEPADFRDAREALADELAAAGITDPRVLEAIRAVPRHRFMPRRLWPHAYVDTPLPIGHEQTISQPFVVALMSQLAEIEPGDKVLEVGTGSGYQAAILAEMGAEVYSIEIVEPLARRAHEVLAALGYDEHIHARIGDGYQGWPEQAPFDAVVITAAPPQIPEPLKEQLTVGGTMVVPVGVEQQELLVLTRTDEGFRRQRSIPVRFVPMTGRAQQEQARMQ